MMNLVIKSLAEGGYYKDGRKQKKQQMSNLKNEQIFIEGLIKNFLGLEEEMLDEDYLSLVTLQIGCFK